MSNIVRHIPNWLTYLRLALIPVFVVLMNDPTQLMLNAAIAVFIFASVTDWVDGFIARKYQAVSDFGKLLDPIADKVLVMAGLVMLVSQRSDIDGRPWVPGWMVVLVLAREIWVTGLRAVAASKGMIVAAGGAGKLKSGFQMVAIVLLMLYDLKLKLFGLEVRCQIIGLSFLLISIFFSIMGAVEYTYAILLEHRGGGAEAVKKPVGT